ncbi:shikimate dehydrogenase [Pyrococcus furiosus DSM 3638]|uniref:Shikimate dehydrogenase (NADP(+)) n=3 Tax=Pyrococcus furiosus TaxID=2261 RepID=AROE_PYRFU|nr:MULTISPECIES: shikimate dehydrogenase [Pyrococcus]Q8U0A6.1 RecName: Full=Shikimate dehydrogenase (NADP(+)); Short=SDH [Pyrococcus furiosus DSM 3638]AAL81817.1 shikimate 5-dehydrogenase [Pyrococcus furiosus DSM 3638]AFN04947.1 shikimate 5-dehydrogenase [Pyrococcus furiosus COM1]MDK2870171.1 shikimate dehydrogenase [Pyrococcus sp.]QEK79310.1 shikimate dehydrogenase [Pyrococcus furiosus DSM 3638]
MINGETKIYGIIGNPVKHSLSPIMHNALFKKFGINAIYVPFEVKKDLKNAINGVKALDIQGVNVTMPYKEEVIKFLDELSEDSQNIGSVNTVVNLEGKLVGYTTDGIGARRALERFTQVDGANILILGAGGAGKAIAYELSKVANVVVLNRTIEKAKRLEKFGIVGDSLEALPYYVEWADILINATSVGMNEEKSLVPKNLLRPGLVVMDIVYKPLNTLLLRYAQEKGCIAIDGLWMLVYQGAESFRLWTGEEGDVELMRRVALAWLRERK